MRAVLGEQGRPKELELRSPSAFPNTMCLIFLKSQLRRLLHVYSVVYFKDLDVNPLRYKSKLKM